jgi:hypothetical protein
MVSAQRYRAEAAKPLRIAARSLAGGRGVPGFGNGRAVRSYLEAAVRRQQERLGSARQDGAPLGEAVNVLTSADLLGPRQLPTQLDAVLQLEAMQGLAAVKAQVQALLTMMAENMRREENEEQPLQVCLNRMFLGNPGTGKTTVAILYAKILKQMGWLSKGDVLIRTPADFIGSVVGESERRTADIIAAARGKVCVRACVSEPPRGAAAAARSRCCMHRSD